MNEEKYIAKMPQNLVLEDRRRLTLTGVEDVGTFDENTVVLKTVLGELTVHGSGLKMGKFNVDTGELCLEGSVTALAYSADRSSRGGFFGRMFR